MTVTIDTDSIEFLDIVPHFWDDCDAIELWLEKHSGALYNPSTIQRRAKVQGDVRFVLKYLDRHRYVVADGNGAWRKYGAHP